MIDHVPYEDQVVLMTKDALKAFSDGVVKEDCKYIITDVFWTEDQIHKCDPGNYDDCYIEIKEKDLKMNGRHPHFVLPYELYCDCRNLYLVEQGTLDKQIAIVEVWDMNVHSVKIVSRADSRNALMLARMHGYDIPDYRDEMQLDVNKDTEEHVNDSYYDRLWGDAHKTLIELCELVD